MGDKKLKKVITLNIFLINILFGNSDIKWIDKELNNIKPVRNGVNKKEVLSLKNPFVEIQKKVEEKKKKKEPVVKFERKEKKKQISFKLSAIMNNAALINNKWHKEGEVINGFKIKKVNYDEVLLNDGKDNIVLTTRTTHNDKFKKWIVKRR